MRTATLRYCLSGILISALPTLTLASLEYSAKTDEAGLFRSEMLDPPPLATLGKGESLKLLHRGADRSEVETTGGLKGWMRNQDLQAMESAPGLKVRLADQDVTAGGTAVISPLVLRMPSFAVEVISLDRSFVDEIAEAMDKEQVEMRHGDN
jgi:hypothetical protein